MPSQNSCHAPIKIGVSNIMAAIPDSFEEGTTDTSHAAR
jgi:hypothetical protein